MTISQKLFLVATLGLNCTPFVSAYDVVGLKDEVQLISAFANQYDTVECDHLGSWLNNKINSTWMTSNSKILEFANIIKQNCTRHSCEELLKIKETEVKKQRDLTNFVRAGVVTLYAGLIICAVTDMFIIRPLQWKISDSKFETSIALHKMQQQINELAQKVDKKTWFQKLFAKQ
jgi:hypothetical protein